jgi:flagellar hook-associated protein 2
MSTSPLALSSSAGSPISVSGLASGLDTSSIVAALMAVERRPVTHLTEEQAKVQAEQSALQSLQGSLQQLAFSVSEFGLPSLFESSQTVVSSEPTRVSAATTSGAGVGGYEVEVTQLANSAQRTFTFTAPAGEETIIIDGHEFAVKAGESAKQLASAINSSSTATVYAAVLEGETVVLSSRTTGKTGGEFIQVTSAGGTLVEKAGTAREGKDAEYSVDGVAGTSTSNTVTNAIAGVTLSLNGLTTTGPVTIDVQAPGASTAAVEAQVQSFIKLYNSTVETIGRELNTKSPSKPQNAGEFATGVLFGDVELTNLLNGMRQSMYEPISGLEGEMSSPSDIGISTGAPTGAGATSQASLEGQLTLDPTKLAEALKANPTGVEVMLRHWSQGLKSVINQAAEAGGGLELRVNGDTAQITQLKGQISNMNEMLALREKALQASYAALEAVISRNTEQGTWLTQQTESLNKSGI